MFSKLFGKKKEEEKENQDNALEEQINDAIKQAEEGLKNEQEEIKSILSSVKDVIIDTYIDYFPNAQYSYYRDQIKEEALEKYPKIKEENASKIDAEVAEKCDKIVKAYLNQVELRKSKILFYEKLVKKYQDSQKQLKEAKEKIDRMKKLEKHSEKLKNMDDDVGELAETYHAQYQLEDITKDFELKLEYYNQVEQLSKEYSNDDESLNKSEAYKDEVDRLLNKI